MWTRVSNWLQPVTLSSENETRIANLLRVLLFTFFVLCTILNPIQVLLGFNRLPTLVVVAIVILGFVYLLMWHLVRLGYLVFASWVVCGMSCIVGTMLVIQAGTILTPFTSIYFIVVILAALLLNIRAVVSATVLSAVLLVAVFWGQTNGRFFQTNTVEISYFTLLSFVTLFGTIAVLMILASNSITQTFASFQQQKEELAHKNQALQHLQDSLAQEVAQRTQEAQLAVDEAKQANALLAEQIWLAIGQTKLSEAMRGKQTEQELAQNILQQMCQYLEVQVGSLFLADEEHQVFFWQAGYAYAPSVDSITQFQLGEGVVGQVARNKQPLLMRGLPPDYLPIVAGTAVFDTVEALFYPFLYNGKVMAVIEFGRWEPFTEKDRLLLDRTAESIGIAFYSVQARIAVDLP